VNLEGKVENLDDGRVVRLPLTYHLRQLSQPLAINPNVD
jgi:hypothetical protein